MRDSIKNEIDELICPQIKAFRKKGSFSQLDLRDCFERFRRLRQLFRDLDRTKKIVRVPWLTLELPRAALAMDGD
jgi:hypothetical protein